MTFSFFVFVVNEVRTQVSFLLFQLFKMGSLIYLFSKETMNKCKIIKKKSLLLFILNEKNTIS